MPLMRCFSHLQVRTGVAGYLELMSNCASGYKTCNSETKACRKLTELNSRHADAQIHLQVPWNDSASTLSVSSATTAGGSLSSGTLTEPQRPRACAHENNESESARLLLTTAQLAKFCQATVALSLISTKAASAVLLQAHAVVASMQIGEDS